MKLTLEKGLSIPNPVEMGSTEMGAWPTRPPGRGEMLTLSPGDNVLGMTVLGQTEP